MRFLETEVAGAFIVELEPHRDERGFFARAFSIEEFAAHGTAMTVAHANTTFTRLKGTIRGLHYQVAPVLEAKLMRCISGSIFQVAVDLRPDSATYLRHVAAELTARDRRALFVPAGCAAGAQALTDDAESLYLVSAPYSPEHERGIRFDDPAFAIRWPLEPTLVSDKDLSWPPFRPAAEASA